MDVILTNILQCYQYDTEKYNEISLENTNNTKIEATLKSYKELELKKAYQIKKD